MGDHREDGSDGRQGEHDGDAIATEACGQLLNDAPRQYCLGDRANLCVEARLRLAHVVAAAVERTAERADRCRIGRAPGHIFRLEWMLADGTGDVGKVLPAVARLASEIEPALRTPGDQRRGD